MRMGRRRRDDEVDVNLTPLIDVVFLLLIFFMISTTFDKASQLEIDLPAAGSDPAALPERTIELAIDLKGRYYLGRQLLGHDRRALRTALEQLISDDPPTLLLRADGNTPHQAVVSALDIARQVGFRGVAIATLEESGAE